MDFLIKNWFWIVIALVFFWMHSKMHGGHGSHGGNGGNGDSRGSHSGHGSGMGCCGDHQGHDEPDPAKEEEHSHAEH